MVVDFDRLQACFGEDSSPSKLDVTYYPEKNIWLFCQRAKHNVPQSLMYIATTTFLFCFIFMVLSLWVEQIKQLISDPFIVICILLAALGIVMGLYKQCRPLLTRLLVKDKTVVVNFNEPSIRIHSCYFLKEHIEHISIVEKLSTHLDSAIAEKPPVAFYEVRLKFKSCWFHWSMVLLPIREDAVWVAELMSKSFQLKLPR